MKIISLFFLINQLSIYKKVENVKTSRQRGGQASDSVELKLLMLLILTAYLVY